MAKAASQIVQTQNHNRLVHSIDYATRGHAAGDYNNRPNIFEINMSIKVVYMAPIFRSDPTTYGQPSTSSRAVYKSNSEELTELLRFDLTFPCRKERRKLEHVMKWLLLLFVHMHNMYNKEVIEKVKTRK